MVDYHPKITIITAVYNGITFLEKSINSVINQSYDNVEYIIIDGGSTDGTVDLLKKYDSRISYWVSEPDQGVYSAWNKALLKATGEWICFIGCDDELYSINTISEIIGNLKLGIEKGCNFIYGKIDYIKPESGKTIEIIETPWEGVRNKLSKNMCLMHSGSFHHSSLFKKYGQFNDTFQIAGDYEFILRCFVDKGFHGYNVSDKLVLTMRAGGISGSLKNRKKLILELIRARKLNGYNFPSTQLMLWYLRLKVFMLVNRVVNKNTSNKLADFYRQLKGKNSRWSE